MLPPTLIIICLFSLILFQPQTFAFPIISNTFAHITTVEYNFTLSAYNISFPNDDLTGAALVLGQNGNDTCPILLQGFDSQNTHFTGATSGVTPHVTSVCSSQPQNTVF
jgi:hypothetical protein